MNLRPYQQDCINTIEAQPHGSYLVQMATGLGKTVTFANLPRHGERMLILSHREELVEQPRKYFDCTYGVERAGSHAGSEEVVSASVQSLVRRLERFSPHDFGLIICNEAHHAAANTYRKIFEYFQPLKLIGFTATPNRGDKIRLSNVFQKIIFQRDLRWGIKNKYLCDILCKRVDIGYDLRAVHTRNGDYAPGELDEAMEGPADAIAQTYREHAAGATLIFAVSVHQAEEIAGRIKGAVVVTGETKNRAAIIEAFTAGKIPCIVNCMGITGKASLCTAPRLLGLDVGSIPAGKRSELQGDLFELPLKAAAAQDCPESWIRNVEIVDLFSMGFRPGLWGGRYSTFIPVRLYRLFPFFALLLHIEYGHAHLHRVISFAGRSKPLHIFCDSKPLR